MRKTNFYASVYWIIKNREWEILFAKRGKNASWFIWRYQIPAGHIDWGETIFEALRREMKEELTI
jgi:8-oxo-dGTP pyrophosphatase MutT (NUDIX family)